MSQPMRSARRRPNSHSAAGLADSIFPSRPKVTMASATVSITERTRCSLARSALVICSARSMAPRRAEASVHTNPKNEQAAQAPARPGSERARARLSARRTAGSAVTLSVQGRPPTVTVLCRDSAAPGAAAGRAARRS